MKFIIIFIVVLQLSINKSYSDENNGIENKINRISEELKILQKFVYTNLSPIENKINNSENNLPTSDNISDIENALKNINSRLEELEIKISDMFSLYIDKNVTTLSNLKSSDGIILEDSSSTILVEKKDTQLLGEIKLLKIEGELPNDPFEAETLDDNIDKSVTNIEQINNAEKKFDAEKAIVIAKNYIASLNNEKATEVLLNIINSKSEDKSILSEAYYWLGRTYYIKNNFNDSVKYFGIRHRDFPSILSYKIDNYFWLAKSLIKIEDKENACLILEDIIFSDDYNEKLGIIEDSKSLQTEQGCGFIIE